MTPDQRRLERHAADSAIVRLWESLVPLTSINSFLQTGAHPDDETSRLLADALAAHWQRSTQWEPHSKTPPPTIPPPFSKLKPSR